MKHMQNITSSLPWIVAVLVLGLTACSPQSGSESANSTLPDSPEGTPAAAFLLPDAPASAPGLSQALAAAEPGIAFLASGRVGGLVDPVSQDFAAFVLADESLQFCDEVEGDDHCATPWDACCEDPAKIAAARAFVQFVDPSGNPLSGSLSAAIGLAPNDSVILRGRISPDSTPANPVIIAEGIAIVP